jgi:hypothetical protein
MYLINKLEEIGKLIISLIGRNVVGGLLGFSPYQGILATVRIIAYGIPTDYNDEKLRAVNM